MEGTSTSASLSEIGRSNDTKQVKASDNMKVTISDKIFKANVKNSKNHTKNKIYEVKWNQFMGRKPGNNEEVPLLNGCDKIISDNLDCNSESDGSSIHEGDHVFDIVEVEKKPPFLTDDALSSCKKIQIEDTVFFLHNEASDVDQHGQKPLPDNIIMDGLTKFVKKELKNLTNGETNEIDRNKMHSNEKKSSQVSGVLDKSSKL